MSGSSTHVYRPPHARNPSWASAVNKKTNNGNRSISRPSVIDTGIESFPELSDTSNQKEQVNIEQDETNSFVKRLQQSDTENDEKQVSETSSLLEKGWIEITSKDVRNMHTTKSRKDNAELVKEQKDPFIYDLLCRDKYIHSLNDEQYKKLANAKMNELVKLYKKNTAEFISVYGIEYYEHIHGYQPVYGKRIMRHYRFTDGNESDSVEVYNEYYTDDEDDVYQNDAGNDEDENIDEY